MLQTSKPQRDASTLPHFLLDVVLVVAWVPHDQQQLASDRGVHTTRRVRRFGRTYRFGQTFEIWVPCRMS